MVAISRKKLFFVCIWFWVEVTTLFYFMGTLKLFSCCCCCYINIIVYSSFFSCVIMYNSRSWERKNLHTRLLIPTFACWLIQICFFFRSIIDCRLDVLTTTLFWWKLFVTFFALLLLLLLIVNLYIIFFEVAAVVTDFLNKFFRFYWASYIHFEWFVLKLFLLVVYSIFDFTFFIKFFFILIFFAFLIWVYFT